MGDAPHGKNLVILAGCPEFRDSVGYHGKRRAAAPCQEYRKCMYLRAEAFDFLALTYYVEHMKKDA
jgi:hypothetical protein